MTDPLTLEIFVRNGRRGRVVKENDEVLPSSEKEGRGYEGWAMVQLLDE